MVPFLAEPLETLLHKPGENIDKGMGAKLYVSTYKRSPKFKNGTLKSLLDGVHRTLSRLIKHMLCIPFCGRHSF